MKENETAASTNQSTELLDLLPTPENRESFSDAIHSLQLSPGLINKIIRVTRTQHALTSSKCRDFLQPEEENELATEALILRHQFTELVCQSFNFRQAAITIISNIYLFANRRIFFQAEKNTEQERQQALLMLTSSRPHVPIARSFQHHILARIWNRICATSHHANNSQEFIDLIKIIHKLNTIRNIYISLSLGFIYSMAQKTPPLYMRGISKEDAVQIASFGVARAAYRYHPSFGVRFSTFSAKWIQKEIQRQALQGRLIRINPHTIGQAKNRPESKGFPDSPLLLADSDQIGRQSQGKSVEKQYEQKELLTIIENFLQTRLPAKSADIIRRRYGLPPYSGKSQSVIDIADHYRVSRGSIYQLQQSSIKKLRKHLAALR